ncbi:ATP-dependent Clp protease ATP-binding subunit [Mesomycoplasma hyorhinis]|nr:AAA family ATPase [Mesomycoplasma hyorhinis]AEX14329.1 ATP-dependent chaperone ClpB [Mesomycoplasma hyorhinis GDL-1]AFX74532.1 ClpB protein [Mesomycoplasma hyorhinis SK76]AHA41339.1 ATP binding ClpB family protein [Mesomycoplasma hyorhinis DBS 1050]AOD25570.1 ATP-dependent chaperone ClpB [Mesomycoplasma hyorhinis]MXR08834.1 AAA family ATPase [Mesomycoplasma hyorhinis]
MQINQDNTNVLEKFGRNLTKLAKENKLDPVINRDEEIRRIIKILSRKTKNNPVLVGEPGVGKTAIVEGIAIKIHQGQIPENLKNKEIWELDVTALIAGASYQGEFEKRLKLVLKEIEKSDGNIIMFIDEIHLLIGTGSAGGNAMDMANILKPMMARGEIKLIGATTINEYRKYIEKDSALERRMQKIFINEPTVDDTITILRGIKERFENFHKVRITDSALVAAASLSARYISDRFLPDKAIDLVDEAAANLKVQMNYQPEVLDKLKQKLAYIQMEKIALNSDDNAKNKNKIEKLEKEIEELNKHIDSLTKKWVQEKEKAFEISYKKEAINNLKTQMDNLALEQKYVEAGQVYNKMFALQKELEELEENKEENTLIKEVVNQEDIANIVSKWTKIPVEKLVESEKDKLLNLEINLAKKVKGQEQAIKLVADSILRFKANINDQNRPIGSFLFLGPTGVGKTELARALAYNLFDSEHQIIRLDMSEYMEKHSVSKLIGSPPGYIGHEEGGQLTEKIRLNPYSIVLFDEIEKAHSDVVNIFLQILDNGFLTDSKGRKVDFRNTIIIFTSNIGAKEILENKKLDFNQIKDRLLNYFKPEFINRLDEIISFNFLNKNVILEIIDLELNNLKNRLEKNSYYVDFGTEIKEFVSKNAYDQNFGARPIKRYIKKEIETFVAKKIIAKEIIEKEQYVINLDKKSNLVLIKK